MLHFRIRIITNMGNKIRNQSGFMLIIVLIFLHIFSLLGLYGLISESRMMKMSSHQWQRQVNVSIAENILYQLQNTIDDYRYRCPISITSAVRLNKMPMEWWKQYGCSDNVGAIRYYYVLEVLGRDDCSVIEQGNTYLSAAYYRITLLLLPTSIQAAKIMLQASIAQSTGEFSTCSSVVRYITPGRQMWREI